MSLPPASEDELRNAAADKTDLPGQVPGPKVDADGEVYGIKDGMPAKGKGMPETAELGPIGKDDTLKFIKWDVPFGTDDFIIRTKFTAEKVDATACAFVLFGDDGNYTLGMDGGKPSEFFIEGGVWPKGPKGPTMVEAGKLHSLTIRRKNGALSLLFDGKTTRLTELPTEAPITAVGWRPLRNRIKVESLSYTQELASPTNTAKGTAKSFLQIDKTGEEAESEFEPDRLLTMHIRRIKGMSFIQKWKAFRQNQKDLLTLTFVLPRMEFHKSKVDVAPGILQHLAGISNLHAELISFAESGSNIGQLLEDIFVEEVEMGLAAAGPMPTKQQTVDFLTGCIDTAEKTKVPECGNMSLKQAAGICAFGEEHSEYKKVEPHLAAVKKKCFGTYAQGIAKDMRKVSQILSWASIPLWASSEFKTRASTFVGVSAWCIPNPLAFGGVRTQVRLKNKLCWTPLVDFYVQKYDIGEIDGNDTMPKSGEYDLQIATRRFVRLRMPRMIFDLQTLRNELAQQVKEIEASRARVMAYGVTVGITLGNIVSGIILEAYRNAQA